jgi:chromosome segregation ATPase
MENVSIEVAELTNKLENTEKLSKEYKKENSTLSKNLEKQNSRINSLETQILTANNQVESLNNVNESITNAFNQKSNELTERINYINVNSDNQGSLIIRLQIAEHEAALAQMEIIALRQQLENTQIMYENSKANVKSFAEKYNLDTSTLKGEIRHLKSLNEIKESELKGSNEKAEALEKQRQKLFTEAEKELQKLRTKIESLERENNLLARGQKIGLISKGIK